MAIISLTACRLDSAEHSIDGDSTSNMVSLQPPDPINPNCQIANSLILCKFMHLVDDPKLRRAESKPFDSEIIAI